ncbi:hypothetical protein FRC08_011343 [Ceratobasidium sp. 394]|nr:hypothetical protein FRC08_011343 [Ceratobasidium sp. 394]KAG9083761.1 hypothetical protein FS749_005752 [Ceratobasidium sp. UAMH 11750]
MMTLNQDTQVELERNVEQEQQERLVSAAKHRLDNYEGEINAQTQKRPIRWVKKYTVGVNNRAGDAIADTVNSFFGIVENVEDDAKRVLDGFKRDIETGLYAILGTSQLGEHEEQRSIEFVHHHALMCVDVRLWRFNFSDRTKGGELNSVFCYVFCKSVLDRKSLTPTQLAYLLSEHAGDKNIEAYIDKLVEVWSEMDGMPEGVMSPNEAQITVLKEAEAGLAKD